MPFYYCPKTSISEMVSTRRNKATRVEVDKATTRGHEKEGYFEGKVY